MKKNKSITKEYKKKIEKIFQQESQKELTLKAISKRIHFKGQSSQLYRIVQQLVHQKNIVEVKRGKFTSATRPKTTHKFQTSSTGRRYQGRVDKIRSGAAYILIDNLDGDIYVPAKFLKGAMNNDIVEVSISSGRGRRKLEGRVESIIERSIKDVIAKLYTVDHVGLAYPLQEIGVKEIGIPLEKLEGAKADDIVMLTIESWPDRPNRIPRARVEEILTDYKGHELTELSILTKYGFNYIFPKSITPELNKISDQGLTWSPDNREDYRDVLTFTIDPADAKDFDDALSYEEYDNGDVEIGVHIADVTHYLQQDSDLDEEARRRATSVYLVGRVCPMLPEILSNDLCSLIEGHDRLSFAVTFRITQDNKITNYWIRKTIIHSDKRLAYEEAQEIIEGKESPLRTAIVRIKEFADHVRKQRTNSGAINFESQEIRFLLDEKKYPTDIYLKERKDSHLMVEDLMLLANKTIATYVDKKTQGTWALPYRVHDEPDLEKISDLALMGKMLGFDFNMKNMNTIRRSFNELHAAAQKNETFRVLQQLGIRSMAKAVYTAENIGHFGLAFSHYTHFTSPIRRYADVLVHRIVHALITKDNLPYGKGKLEAICSHISRRERLAMEAERESIKLKQAQYMSQFIGQEFNGKISGFIERGMFINLDEGVGEGLVPFHLLDEAFDIHPSRFSAKGMATGQLYAMGDRVRVRVEEVDVERRRIEMVLID